VADEHFAAPPDTTEATEEVPVEEAPAEEAPAEEATEDTPEDEAGRLVADRLEALRASSAARAALEAAPDPDAPVPRKEYEPEEMRRAPGEDELPRDAVTMHHSFGFESVKRNNLHYLSEEVIIFTVGALVQTVHLGTGEQTYLYGIDGEGVGFVVVHPEKTHFALGEKGVNPSVYIYETQTLKLKRVLVGGTERAYSCGRFSNDGSKLATVGGYPDFWLTVWDWREEAIVLRSKAFSQEVFDVTFSPFFDGQLTTSGTGHIRFWKMAGDVHRPQAAGRHRPLRERGPVRRRGVRRDARRQGAERHGERPSADVGRGLDPRRAAEAGGEAVPRRHDRAHKARRRVGARVHRGGLTGTCASGTTRP
jgi:hypothetical protein